MKALLLTICVTISASLAGNTMPGNSSDYNKSFDSSHSLQVENEGNKVYFHIGLDYEVKYRGDIILTPDDKEIIAISPNGFIRIKRSTFGNSRELQIVADENGKLTASYKIGKSEAAFDPDGKKWLAEVLPEIVKETGVGAMSRVRNIYKDKGIEGLIDEILEVDDHSSSVRNLYFVIAVDHLKLSNKELTLLIPEMERIESNSTKGTLMREILYKYDLEEEALIALLKTTSTLDYNTERGSVLRVINPDLPLKPLVIEAYFEIIDEMSINSEKGNVLKHLLKVKKLDNKTFTRFFESVRDFSHEREKGAVLLASIEYLPVQSETVMYHFHRTVESLPSSYYVLKGEIVNTLTDKQIGALAKGTPNKAIILPMLKSVEHSESNSQKALALRKVNRIFSEEAEVVEAYFNVLENMDAEIEAYNVVLDLLNKNELSERTFAQIFEFLQELVSDDYQHAAGAVLRDCIEKMPDSKQSIDQFFSVVKSMDQNSTIEEILRMITNHARFENNKDVYIQAIESAQKISVDIEIAYFLFSIKETAKKDNDIKYAYKRVAKEIKSNYLKMKVFE